MGKDMASDVHVNVTTDKTGNQIVFHNPGIHPLAPNTGKVVTAAVKPAGQPNGNVQGQVSNSTIIISNPA